MVMLRILCQVQSRLGCVCPVAEKRKELFKLVNGNAFYSPLQWPSWVRRAFWEKRLSDGYSFKMMLFLAGNSLDPHIVCK